MPALKHTPMKGNKLVGVVPLGTFSAYDQPGKVIHSARINLTNPNCKDEILVKEMCIVKTSQIPTPGITTVKYSGQFLVAGGGWSLVAKDLMKPHESWGCPLFLVPGIGPLDQDHALYYIEIGWISHGKLPLIGIEIEDTRIYYDNGDKFHSQSQSLMVNMRVP